MTKRHAPASVTLYMQALKLFSHEGCHLAVDKFFLIVNKGRQKYILLLRRILRVDDHFLGLKNCKYVSSYSK